MVPCIEMKSRFLAYAVFAYQKIMHPGPVLFQPSGKINRRYYIGLA